MAQKLVAIDNLSAKTASGAVSAAQNLTRPLLVPKIKIDKRGKKTNGSIMNTSMPILSGLTTSKPRTWRMDGMTELMSDDDCRWPIADCRFDKSVEDQRQRQISQESDSSDQSAIGN